MYLYWQKCHKKPFPLVYCQSHKEKSVKGGRKTAEFPLDTLFLLDIMSEGKMAVSPLAANVLVANTNASTLRIFASRTISSILPSLS